MPVTVDWQKSSRSMTNGNCVKVRQPEPDVPADSRAYGNVRVPGRIQIGDTKDPGAMLVVPATAWFEFTGKIKAYFLLQNAFH